MPDDSAPLLAPHGVAALSDRCQVTASSSRAVASYDVVAKLQRSVDESLLSALPGGFSSRRWVGLGYDTDHFSRALERRFDTAEGLAVDIAGDMLQRTRMRGGASRFIGGDVEKLPLYGGSYGLLFSSLVTQWCTDLSAVLVEARRVLWPGGVLTFSGLCVGTLGELHGNQRMVDGFVHVNRFRIFADYLQHAADSDLLPLTLRHGDRLPHLPGLRSLTHELKALDTHNLDPGRPGGLTGHQRIRALVTACERFRQPGGLPVTYCVIFDVLRKDC